ELAQAGGRDGVRRLLDALEALDQFVRVQGNLCRRGARRDRHVEARIDDGLPALRADVAPRLVEAFHQVAVALLDAGAQPPDVRVAHAQYRVARLLPRGQQRLEIGDGRLAGRRNAGLIALQALRDAAAAKVYSLAQLVDILRAIPRQLIDGLGIADA